MKDKIYISSSSYLLKDSKSWSALKKFNLEFSEYNFFDELLIKKSNYYSIVLSFKDLIEYPLYDCSLKNFKKIKKKILNIFRIIEKKVVSEKSTIILFCDFFYTQSLIRTSQNFPLEEKIIQEIKNKINSLFKFNNFFFFNIDNFKKEKSLFDDRLFYLSKTRYSIYCLDQICKNIILIINRLNKPVKKVLVLDCDNTLWGGIVGEDGYSNLKIGTDGEGSIFSDFQKTILRLKNEGTLLCICSKNNYNDILQVFKKNKNMILKINDFSLIKSNWESKTQNIIHLSKELGLSLDSFSFFDDNPIERDQIKKNLPDVDVIEPDKDISNWPQQLFDYFEFTKFKLTKEDMLKTKQYQNRLKFLEEKNKNTNSLTFLKKIQLNASIVFLDKSNEQRCLQLIQKTNQFNLTTKRYNLDQINIFKKNKKNIIFMVHLKDKYGDHGLTGLIMLRLGNNYAFIDNMTLSCRVLGRHLEDWIVYKVTKMLKSNINFIIGEYTPSKKNAVVSNFYKKLGFKNLKKINILNDVKKFTNKKSLFYISKVNELKLINSKIYK